MSAEAAVLLAEALLVAGLYVQAARRVPRWPQGRTAAFLAGVAVTFTALGLPDARLEAHMAQHLALALVGAPLLVAGSPLALALRAAHRPARALLRAPWLAHPLVGWLALSSMMVGAHAPMVWDATDHGAAHVAAHAAWLAAGALFWRPLIGVDPVPHRPRAIGRLLLLVTAMAPMGAVGSTMLDARSAWYAAGTAAQTRAAGAIMWIAGGCVLAAATVGLGWSAALEEHRRQVRAERNTRGQTPGDARNATGLTAAVARNATGQTPAVARNTRGQTPAVARNATGLTAAVARNTRGQTPAVAPNATGQTPAVAQEVLG